MGIQSNLYLNPTNLIHTNICNSTSTNFIIHIPPYRYVPLNLITDHDLIILPNRSYAAGYHWQTGHVSHPPSYNLEHLNLDANSTVHSSMGTLHPFTPRKCKSQTQTRNDAHNFSMPSAAPPLIPAAGLNSPNS